MRDRRDHSDQNNRKEIFMRRKMHDNAADRNDKLILNLRDLSHTMRFLYEGRGSQKRILIVLSEIGGSVTQKELTERLGIQPGSASEVIAKLEDAGYIKRTPNEADRRTINIDLTGTGKTAAEEARKERKQRHEQMFSCLSEDEKEELLSLLEKVNTDWKQRYQDMGENHGPHKHHHKGHGHDEEMHRHRDE
ncbi:MAG: MarR family transcriptional regulator [Lachnospiraceae bacterium]|nr:MarR family transcriptional regulator [Lachnospiraceae bacterium]